MSSIVLYSYFRSSCSQRIRIILGIKGLEYEYRAVNLLKKEQMASEFKGVNAMQQVPSMTIDGITISQSVAIAEYLEETRPETPLMPSDPKAKAIVREIVEVINSGTQPMQNLPLLNKLEGFGGPEAKMEWAQYAVGRGLQAAEALVSEYGGKYAYGDTLTMADAFLIPQIHGAINRFKIDVPTLCPCLYRVYENTSEIPAFVAAAIENQPDTQM